MNEDDKVLLYELNETYTDGFVRGYNRGFLDGIYMILNLKDEDQFALLTFNEDGSYSTFVTLGGMPKCIAFGPSNNSIYIADLMNKVVYEKPIEKDKDINFIFRDYCGVSLKGPTSLVRSKDDDFNL